MHTQADKGLSIASAHPSLRLRIAIVAIALSTEKLLLGLVIDRGGALKNTGVEGALWSLQHWGLRFIVTVGAALALLTFVERNEQLSKLGSMVRALPIRRSWIYIHGASAVVLLPLSAFLYGDWRAHPAFLVLAPAWALFALVASGSLMLAMAPGAIWRRAAAGLGWRWVQAGVAASAAVSLVACSHRLWPLTAHVTFFLVKEVLLPFLPGLQTDAPTHILNTGYFAVRVTEACSGLEGIGLILTFLALWLGWFHREYVFPRALIVIPIGVLLMFCLNILRIAVLVLIGNAGYPNVAAFGFHSQAGWITFNAAAIGIAVTSHRSAWLSQNARNKVEAITENPTAAYVMPLLAILAAGMLARAISGELDLFYGLRLLCGAGALWAYRRRLLALDWRCSWRGVFTGVVVFGVWILLGWVLEPAKAIPVDLLALAPASRALWIAVRAATAVLVVPVVEEVAYRGYLMRRLVAADFESVSFARVSAGPLIGAAIAFGIVHGALWPAGILAGLAYGVLVRRTGRIGEAVAAHATTNALLAATVLVGGQWQFW